MPKITFNPFNMSVDAWISIDGDTDPEPVGRFARRYEGWQVAWDCRIDALKKPNRLLGALAGRTFKPKTRQNGCENVYAGALKRRRILPFA